MYQQHLDKPIPVRCAGAGPSPGGTHYLDTKHDELIVGNRASEVRAAPIFPAVPSRGIEKEIDDPADRPGVFRVRKKTNVFCTTSVRGGAVKPSRSLLRHVYR